MKCSEAQKIELPSGVFFGPMPAKIYMSLSTWGGNKFFALYGDHDFIIPMALIENGYRFPLWAVKVAKEIIALCELWNKDGIDSEDFLIQFKELERRAAGELPFKSECNVEGSGSWWTLPSEQELSLSNYHPD